MTAPSTPPDSSAVDAPVTQDSDAMPLPGPDARRVRTVIVGGVVLVLLGVLGLYFRAASRTNHVALSQAPKPVSIVKALAASYRPVRSYVGTTSAWNSAKVGPQYVSAYVGAVLVRPGAVVKRGQVLATLDCRNASAASQAIAARAKALDQRQVAIEHERSAPKSSPPAALPRPTRSSSSLPKPLPKRPRARACAPRWSARAWRWTTVFCARPSTERSPIATPIQAPICGLEIQW